MHCCLPSTACSRSIVGRMRNTSSNMYCNVYHALSNVHTIAIMKLIVTKLSALFPYHPLWDGFCVLLPVCSQCLSAVVAFWAPGGGSWLWVNSNLVSNCTEQPHLSLHDRQPHHAHLVHLLWCDTTGKQIPCKNLWLFYLPDEISRTLLKGLRLLTQSSCPLFWFGTARTGWM